MDAPRRLQIGQLLEVHRAGLSVCQPGRADVRRRLARGGAGAIHGGGMLRLAAKEGKSLNAWVGDQLRELAAAAARRPSARPVKPRKRETLPKRA